MLKSVGAAVYLSLSLALVILPENGSAAKILSVAFISTKSHKITYEPLLHELAKRGHEVTVLTPIPAKKKMKNLREILTIDAQNFFDDMPNMYEMKEAGEDINPFKMMQQFGAMCNMTYDLPHVRELMKETFDLVLLSAIFNECTAGFVHHFNTSLILVSPGTAPSWVTSILGHPSPPSFVGNVFLGYEDKMSFKQRLVNLVSVIGLSLIQNYSYKPGMEAIYRERLGDPNIPSSDEILRNASLILANNHLSLSRPKPTMSDVIEVGGMHCRAAESLPKVPTINITFYGFSVKAQKPTCTDSQSVVSFQIFDKLRR
jgi:glucuronosyltransferase